MMFCFKRLIFILLIAIAGNFGESAQQKKRSPEDWELLFLHCQQQINKHATEYPTGKKYLRGLKDYMPYVHALEVFADDRNKAHQNAQEAQAEGNPYYFNKFMDLVDRAQGEGNGVLNLADILFRLEDAHGRGDGWANWCMKADVNGKPLYKKAKELSFDKGITQKQVQILLRASLDNLENGYEYLPSVLWPRGNVNPKADKCLSYVEKVRKLAKYFELNKEYKDATDIMNRYLKDALCLLDNGHQWYLDLANEYELEDAKKHIKGFYATLYGKVEAETSEGIKPADGTTVTVTDPHDGRTWQGKADEEGNYEIKGVILHKKCSPFELSVVYGSEKEKTAFTGPLSEPDPSCRHEENLLINLGDFTADINISMRWNLEGDHTFTKGFMNMNISGKLKLDEEMSEIGGGYLTYVATRMMAVYKYEEQVIAKEPDCSDLVSKESASGLVPLNYPSQYKMAGRLTIHKLGSLYKDKLEIPDIPKVADVLIDWYYLFIGFGLAPKQIISGQSVHCPGPVYSSYENTILDDFDVSISFKMNTDDQMSGNMSWTSDHVTVDTGVGVSNLPETFDEEPFVPENTPGGVNYSIQWNISKIER